MASSMQSLMVRTSATSAVATFSPFHLQNVVDEFRASGVGASVKRATETGDAQTWTCRRLDPESRRNRPCRYSGGPRCWSKGLPSGRRRAASSSQFAAGLWRNHGTANLRWSHKPRVPARLQRVTNMVQWAGSANQLLKTLRKQNVEPSVYSLQLKTPSC